jgi:alanyl aminopeptidase
MPYPYAKLDQLAVPSFFGAMENPGLVTYFQYALAPPPGTDTVSRRRGFADTCAHELAHMWFGDLVTMRWWDDAWLNEAFATWMAARVVAEWQPTWRPEVAAQRSARYAMTADALATARAIRQPITSLHSIREAFDTITYSKGAAVLAMLERWAGAERFRDGIRAYIRAHAEHDATAADFLAAMRQAGMAPVADALPGFVDQAGLPQVEVELACEAGSRPSLVLRQSRYAPLGSDADPERRWHIPVCVRYDAGASSARACTLLAEATGSLELDEADRCPRWVVANEGGLGYYRVRYSASLLDRVLAHARARLTLGERLRLIDDLVEMVGAGTIGLGDALARVPELATDPDPMIVAATASLASVPDGLIPPEQHAAYRKFVRDVFGARARTLGWRVTDTDDDETRLLRPVLLALVARKGADPQLSAEARSLASAWLDDREAIHPDVLDVALSTGLDTADAALWQRFYEQARAAATDTERRQLLGAMAAFADPALVERNLALTLSDEFFLGDSATLLFAGLSRDNSRATAFAFVRDHFDELLARYPRFRAPALAGIADVFCTDEDAAAAETLLRPRIERVPGGPRVLEQALESARLCAAYRAHHAPSLADFLRQRR